MQLLSFPQQNELPKVNDEAIRLLEEALEMAREGKVSDFALVAIAPNGDVMSCWNAPKYRFSVVGALDYLKSKVNQRIQESV